MKALTYTYNKMDICEKTQKKMDWLQQQKSAFMEMKQLLFRMVDLYCQKSPHVTLEMLEQMIPSLEQALVDQYVVEVSRLIKIIRILCLEKKYGLTSFCTGISSSEELLKKYQNVMFALRRIELGPEEKFADSGVEWVVEQQISPIAVGVISKGDTFANHVKIYTRLLQRYESVGVPHICEVYRQFLGKAGEKDG